MVRAHDTGVKPDAGDQGSNPPSAEDLNGIGIFFPKKSYFLDFKTFFPFVPPPFTGLPLFHLTSPSSLHLSSLLPPQVCQSVFLICFITPGMLAR